MTVIGLLVNSTIKMSLVIVIALAVIELLRTRSAALRHWVLAVAVGCAAAIPVLDAIRPASSLPLRTPGSIQTTGQRPIQPERPSTMAIPGRLDVSDQTDQSNPFALERISPLLRAIWLAGLIASVFLMLAGLARLTRLAARSRRLTTGRWSELASETADAYGLRRPFVLLQSDHPSLLGTWGFAVPKVILPAAASGWSEERARVVLWHELAHIRRGDWVAQMGVELLRAVYWFNPIVWILSRRLQIESEHACDEEVMNRGIPASAYATHLVDLARALAAARPLFPGFPAPAMARPSSLERRVRAMFNEHPARNPMTGSTRVLIVAALLAATVAIAAGQNVFSTFSGSVRDAQGAVIPNVTLILSNALKQTKYEIKSDSAGSFEFAGLQAGDYELEASMPGFGTLREGVSVSGQNQNRDLVLQVGSLEETITVFDPEKYDPAEVPRRRSATSPAAGACTPSPTGGTIQPPIRLADVGALYPATLHGTGTKDMVVIDGHIGLDGFIKDVQVRNQPHPDFADAAITAVNQWQWSQTLLDCVPVEVPITVTVRFVPAS